MAKGGKLTRETVDQVVDRFEGDSTPDPIDIILAAAAEDGDGQWTFEVREVMGPNVSGIKEPWLFDCALGELENLKYLLRDDPRYGPGRYRVRCRYNKQFKKQFDIEIASPKMGAAPLQTRRDRARDDDADDRFERMLEQQQKFMTAIIDRLAPATERTSALDDVERLIPLMQVMRGDAPAAAAAPAPDPMQSIESAMAIVEKVQSLGGAREAAGDGGLVGLVTGLLNSDLVKTLAAGFINSTMQQPPAPAAAPGRIAAPLIAAPPPAPAPAAMQTGDLPKPLGDAMPYIIAQASAGADPQVVGDWVLDNMPMSTIEALEQQDDVVTYLERQVPTVGAHRAWFTALVENLFVPADAIEAPGQTGDHARPDSTTDHKPANS